MLVLRCPTWRLVRWSRSWPGTTRDSSLGTRSYSSRAWSTDFTIFSRYSSTLLSSAVLFSQDSWLMLLLFVVCQRAECAGDDRCWAVLLPASHSQVQETLHPRVNTGSLKYCHTITVSSDIVQADDRDDEDLQQGAGHRLQHLPVLPSRGLQGNRVIMTYLFLHYTCTVCTKISDCNR